MSKNLKSFFASCPKGLEELLKKEIDSLGIEGAELAEGGVSFKSFPDKALDVIFESRIASRLFMELFNYQIKGERDLYDVALRPSWKNVMDLNQTFKITTLLDIKASYYFKNSLALSQILKDALVDKYREESGGERPSVDTKNPDVSFLLRIEDDRKNRSWKARILLDLCGDPLSNRGYRVNTHSAPLRENLAAGIVMLTEFNPKKDIFVDSMCGSGTLLIEAALIKGGIPPSYLKIRRLIERKYKSWDFLGHKWFEEDSILQKKFEDKVNKLYTKILNSINSIDEHQFYGFDLDRRALEAAKENMREALILGKVITLAQQDATALLPPAEAPGIVICNPPYGERIGDKEALADLYYNYGENLKKNWKGFRAFVFTGEPELRKQIALQTARRFELFNGSLDCRLLRYELY